MSKIKSLLSTYSGRIYVYLADGETGKRFLHDAEDEGFTFADGVKPTEREPDGIFAVNDDMTITMSALSDTWHIGLQTKSAISLL